VFLDHFNTLILKIIFKNKKYYFYIFLNKKQFKKYLQPYFLNKSWKFQSGRCPSGCTEARNPRSTGTTVPLLILIFEFPLYQCHLINYCRKIDNYKRRNFLLVYCNGFYWYNFYLSVNINRKIILIYIKRITMSK
jgi:hypothetical protein